MSMTFKAGDTTIHRIIEMECGFTPALEFLPNLKKEVLDGEPLLAASGGARCRRQSGAVLPVLCGADRGQEHPGR